MASEYTLRQNSAVARSGTRERPFDLTGHELHRSPVASRAWLGQDRVVHELQGLVLGCRQAPQQLNHSLFGFDLKGNLWRPTPAPLPSAAQCSALD